MSYVSLILGLLSISVVNGFHISPVSLNSPTTPNKQTIPHQALASAPSSTTSMYSTISPASKFFNLEEMEDKESCTTEVFLSQDGSVTLTETNGPPPVESYGRWRVYNDGKTFEMTVTRTYSSGRDHTAIGEFKFDVERIFMGELLYVGSLVGVEGSMHMQDEFRGGDVEVGFFSMIDTTDEKLGERGL